MIYKKAKGIFILSIFLFFVCISLWYIFVDPYLKTNKAVYDLVIEPINFNLIEDGIYSGMHQIRKTTYRVIVIVHNKKVTKVTVLENAKTRKAKKAEFWLQMIVQEQTLSIDTVSGATLSSKALLKAAENALRQGYLKGYLRKKYKSSF